MAHHKRYLTFTLAALLGLIIATKAVAQQPSEPTVIFRAIAVGSPVSNLYYETSPGKRFAITAGGDGLSLPYVSPASGLVSFFREVPSEEPGGVPRRVQIATAHLGKGGPYLVVLASSKNHDGSTGMNTLVVNDSWEIHPMQTVRVFNFSRRLAAVNIEAETIELSQTQSHVFSYPPKRGSVRFKVALTEENGWVLRVCCPQGVLPNARSTIVITDVVPTKEEPNPVDINITNVFDTSQPPPPPGSTVSNRSRP